MSNDKEFNGFKVTPEQSARIDQAVKQFQEAGGVAFGPQGEIDSERVPDARVGEDKLAGKVWLKRGNWLHKLLYGRRGMWVHVEAPGIDDSYRRSAWFVDVEHAKVYAMDSAEALRDLMQEHDHHQNIKKRTQAEA